jgi:catechol 2,3-dioxygenase-like lactoylglutathione lyase family enzyme
MMQHRISLITLGVSDLETTAAFYEALGWDRVETA